MARGSRGEFASLFMNSLKVPMAIASRPSLSGLFLGVLMSAGLTGCGGGAGSADASSATPSSSAVALGTTPAVAPAVSPAQSAVLDIPAVDTAAAAGVGAPSIADALPDAALAPFATAAQSVAKATCNVATQSWGSFEHAYAANSPWNSRPVSPVLGSAVIATSTYFPMVSTGAYSTQSFKATASDGPATVTGLNGGKINNADAELLVSSVVIPHWPAGVKPATGSDGHAEIVDTSTGIVHSFWQLRQVGTGWQAAQYAWGWLNGRGMGDPAHYFQGARAAGVSTLGGLMRSSEVNDGDTQYRHALAMSVTQQTLSSTTHYVFPVTSADGNASTAYTGNIPMGSLIMLPPSFNVSKLATPALRKVAQTLMTYGAYVVDANTGTPYAIYVENGSGFNLHPNGWSNTAASDLQVIRAAMHPMQSAASWVDGNGNAVDPKAPLNIISMRGSWYKTSGPTLGVFDTWRQAVVFPPTTTPIVQNNAGGRAYSGVTWGLPTVGAPYQLTATTTGNARFRMTLTDRKSKAVVYDSGDMSNAQVANFNWPTQNFLMTTYAKSGVGGVQTTVTATLLPVAQTSVACTP